MGLKDLFRRPEPIRTLASLEDFLDSRAAFTAQKCVYEFSRAAAGYMWQPLFKEQTFLDALERSRWQVYPLALADVGEVALGVLRPHALGRGPDLVAGLQLATRRTVARYPVPPGASETFWSEATKAVSLRLARAGGAATRAVKDISRTSCAKVLAAMPLHEQIKGRDPEFVRNNFTMSLLGVHEELTRRADAEALAALLVEDGAPAT
jgi:hypothetical protein